MSEPSSRNSGTHTKLKRTILVGVLISLGIIGWHLYEFLIHKKGDVEQETVLEHEIHELSQKLYEEELKQKSHLAKVSWQGKTKSYDRDDRAPHPLLELLNEDFTTIDKTSTIYHLKRLFDNYELDTHAIEHATAEEQQEELEFLQAILRTPIMKRTMKFLQNKGAVTASPDAQLQLLKDIWFTQYSRGQGRLGSSGFEHVFLAELKDHSILGLHNWIYFNEQEKLGHLDYKGHIDHMDFGKDHQHFIAAVRFSFYNVQKPYNTLFIGTSPELEMSLYTVCFLLSIGEPCPVHMGTVKFTISTHVWDWHGKKVIASAYPSIE